MSADQTPATDPTPGLSRVDVAGLRAITKRAAWGWGGDWTAEVDDVAEWSVVHADGKRSMVGSEDSDVIAFIAAADPTTVLALLDERDDLAARLATAETAVERLGRWKAEALPVMRGLQYLGRALGVPIGESITARASVDRAFDLRNRAEVAEAAVRDLTEAIRLTIEYTDLPPIEGWSWYDALRKRAPDLAAWMHADYHRRHAPDLALDPDAPTGHDGQGDQPEGGAKWDGNRRREPIDPQQADALMQQRLSDGHGDPDTHQGDTEAGDGR